MSTITPVRACALGAACGLAALVAAPPAHALPLDLLTSVQVAERTAHLPARPTRKQILRKANVDEHGVANISAHAPLKVRRMIHAGNSIAKLPYVWGGGHGSWKASGYDCSGSVGFALHGAGLLKQATTSGGLASYGRPGPGRWVTIYANGGHTYMVIAGLRFDTSAHGVGGSRWTEEQRDGSGYVVRHPAGL